MAFPTLRPTSREYSPGDWPTKRFNSQSGAEIRFLYGNQRTNAKLSLTYENIEDANALAFLDDYDAQYGTLRTFRLPVEVRAGWAYSGEGVRSGMAAPANGGWRYESEPQVRNVKPGRSSVTVNLVAVF
jgi:hypothetical protein